MNITFSEMEAWARLNSIVLQPFEIKIIKHLSAEFTNQYHSDIEVAPYGVGGNVTSKLKDAFKVLKRK